MCNRNTFLRQHCTVIEQRLPVTRDADTHGDGIAGYSQIYCTPHEQLRESTMQAIARADEARSEQQQAEQKRRTAARNGRNRAVSREEAARLMQDADAVATPIAETPDRFSHFNAVLTR